MNLQWFAVAWLVCFQMSMLVLGDEKEGKRKPGTPASTETKEQKLPSKGTAKEWHAARKQGWELASFVVSVLEKGDEQEFPGTAAWLKDFRKQTSTIDPKTDPDKWPMFDADLLVTNNPNFWRLQYEIAPGDPGIALLQAGLHMAGGEPTRASYLIIVYQQRPGIPEEINRPLDAMLYHTQQARRLSDERTSEGTKLFDEGKYDEALKKYDEGLKLFPQNGWTHYEWGMTVRQKQWIAAGLKPPEGDKLVVNSKLKTSPEVVAAFVRAKRHDPFQWKAYQGEGEETIKSFKALIQNGMPNWEKILTTRPKRVEDEVLQQFAEGCQGAQIHDLALAALQVRVARRGRFKPEDHPFISTSLRKLAPGEATEDVLKRLSGKELKLRQIVPPKNE